jgi:hypothetical protein
MIQQVLHAVQCDSSGLALRMGTQYLSSRKPLKVLLDVLPEFLKSTKDSCAVCQVQLFIANTEQALQFVASHWEKIGFGDFFVVLSIGNGKVFSFHSSSSARRPLRRFHAAAQISHRLNGSNSRVSHVGRPHVYRSDQTRQFCTFWHRWKPTQAYEWTEIGFWTQWVQVITRSTAFYVPRDVKASACCAKIKFNH